MVNDIRKNNSEKDYEMISVDIMYEDEFLKKFFNENERLLIKEAIQDQRANMKGEPKNF